MLKIYNTLTRQKEVLVPIEPGKLRMYVCGMTVYDFCHLGHARVMVAFDVVARHLRASGYALTYVRNITDIDDKIIQRANENGEAFEALTERFIAAMHEDERALGVLPPDHEPKATHSIDDILSMIQTLIAKGHAYVGSNGDVFYAVQSFKSYGRLSGKQLEDLQSGSRVDVDDAKKDPLDFVLWKMAKPDEPSWSSPWGRGGRVGISNAPPCRPAVLATILISMAVEWIFSFPIMKMKSHKARVRQESVSLMSGCIMALFGSMRKKCPSHWAIFSPSGKCSSSIVPRSFDSLS